ncbi:GIP, partial [Symbiodinium sp. CCMP2456]
MWADAVDAYFSNLVIPIGMNVFLAIMLFCVLLAAHEAHVAAGARPLFANHERSNHVALQVVIVLSWVIMFMNVALLVPVSLDFSRAMGQSATASGVFIGGGTAFSLAGLMAGKPLTSEVNWNQRLARGIFLVCNSLCLVTLVGMAILVETAAPWSLNTRRWAFWLIVLLNGMVAFLKAVWLLSWTTMWQIITPASQKTFWQMMAQCGRNGGFVLGPVAFAGLSFLVEQGRDVSPISMMSWAIIGLVVLQAVELACASLFYPTVLNDTAEKGPEVTSPETEEAGLMLPPE